MLNEHVVVHVGSQIGGGVQFGCCAALYGRRLIGAQAKAGLNAVKLKRVQTDEKSR